MMRIPSELKATIVRDALHGAMADLCRGGSWEGVVHGVAWRVASADPHEPRSIETLAGAADAIFASLIEDAFAVVGAVVDEAWDGFLEQRPGNEESALAAARLDAFEESALLVESMVKQVVEALQPDIEQHAA
jgi:hypothetical protein